MTATVIDAFVTTLGLDGTLFRKGMKDAEKSQNDLDKNTKRINRDREKAEQDAAKAREKRQKQLDEQGKKTVDGYKKIRNELLAITALFTAGAGVKDFLANTISTAANLGYLSQNLRMSTEQLTSWQRASERAGGSADGIIAQLKESAETLAQLRSGMGPNEGLQAFFRWGGKADEIKDGNTYLLARSRIISEMFRKDPAQAALIAKQMGIGEDQFNFLKQGPDAVMALVHAQEKNAAITAKDAEEALRLRNRLLDLRDSLTSTGTRIAVQLIPLIDMLVEKLTKLSQWAVDHKDDIARWVDNTVRWIKEFSKDVNAAAEAVGGWKNVLIGLAAIKALSIAASFATLASSLMGVAGALTSIAGAGGALGVLGGLGAAGLGGAAGYAAGSIISNNLSDETNNTIGRGVAKILAKMGVTSAQEALDNEEAASKARRSASGQIKSAQKPVDAKQIVNKLIGMGWTREQAAGITASFKQESELNPAARNPVSGAYGIGQWLGSRVADFKAFTGRDLVGSSLDDQLRFFQYEVTRGKEKSAGDKLRAAITAEDAARIHSEAYERPGEAEANIARRQRLAAQLAAEGRAANVAAVRNIPIGAPASVAGPTTNTATSRSEINIENINIQTQATDARGIAQTIRPAVEKYTFTSQANTGQR
jgi:hypothetical protein